MVSFRGTYWISYAYFVLLRVFCFFQYLISFQYLKQSSGVGPMFLNGASRGELLQPNLVINVTGLVQSGENLSHIFHSLAS